jgi:signal transduction histidine kinase
MIPSANLSSSPTTDIEVSPRDADLSSQSPFPTPPSTHPPFSLSADHYHKLLTQIAGNIRRTLDLPTIWQQTVQRLGTALEVSRCVICPYKEPNSTIKIVAEYHRESVPSLLNTELPIADHPALDAAIAAQTPLAITDAADSLLAPGQSVLIAATCYQDQPNGLIMLYQCDRPRTWSAAEIEFLRELADQVGTAIAHATLFAETQALAAELQLTNSRSIQKNRELEEARQQAEEASRLKSQFLANTSHELRTPLNGMIGFLKLIIEGLADDPKEQSEFINEAYRSALLLNDIITDILDIARIEAGKFEIDLNPVQLDDLLTEMETFSRNQVQQRNLTFEIQKPPTHDGIVLYGNYQRLKQVLLNLLGNAIKFTHDGGITIGVEVIKKKITVQNQTLPGMVKVRVADTGIGVSLDQQNRLFQSFSQIDGTRTRQYGGTGLGLAISQRLVEAMGGEVNFYSLGEGLGSTVTFTAPLFQEPIMSTSPQGARAIP